MGGLVYLFISLLTVSIAVAVSLMPHLWLHFISTGLLTFFGFVLTIKTIPKSGDKFIEAHLSGIDLCKKNRKLLPEAVGVLAGAIFLIVMFLMLPIPFLQYVKMGHFTFWLIPFPEINLSATTFDSGQFKSMLAAMLSICCMIVLGFVDDVFNLRWLYKLILPTIASMPLLAVYAITYNQTWILLPKPFQYIIDLGLLYYLYMGMMAVFCTNAINILAGINGLEVGQSLVIACSVLIFNLCEFNGDQWKMHIFSFTFILPFIGVSMALFYYNSYPATVFVGDTYCYFAGMTFAVVGILGHFSKTMLLFFIPQIFNFLFSCPQLFHFLPCPRHRLPTYDSSTDLLNTSKFEYNPKEVKVWGKICLFVARIFHLAREEKISSVKIKCTNFTLINLILHWMGPMREDRLVNSLLLIQILCSTVAFIIRYYVVQFVY